jgi:hypothetical protein
MAALMAAVSSVTPSPVQLVRNLVSQLLGLLDRRLTLSTVVLHIAEHLVTCSSEGCYTLIFGNINISLTRPVKLGPLSTHEECLQAKRHGRQVRGW